MRSRRDWAFGIFTAPSAWLAVATGALLPATGCTHSSELTERADWILVNDVRGELNPTLQQDIRLPSSLDAVRESVIEARGRHAAVSISGGRHALGGQQFGTDTILLDTTRLNQVLAFDPASGLIQVEAGIRWSDLLDYLERTQAGHSRRWTIRQKQSGGEDFTVGGSLSANIHGRGFFQPPMIQDVESFTLVDADGAIRLCSRHENSDLFGLVVGGYGLFGVVVSVSLRLQPELVLVAGCRDLAVADIGTALAEARQSNCVLSEYALPTDPTREDGFREGVWITWTASNEKNAGPVLSQFVRPKDTVEWRQWMRLAHESPAEAYRLKRERLMSLQGVRVRSGALHRSPQVPHYHKELDRQIGASGAGSDMLAELCVPEDRLPAFLDDVRQSCLDAGRTPLSCSVRFVDADDESFLRWAKAPFACVLLDFHLVRANDDPERLQQLIQRLIDHALQAGGTFALSMHRWATAEQIEGAFPEFVDFLKKKQAFDPLEVFQSSWYRHQKNLFSARL